MKFIPNETAENGTSKGIRIFQIVVKIIAITTLNCN